MSSDSKKGRMMTESKQAELALAESEERFRNVFEHAVVGKSITALDGGMRINKALCDMLGYSKEELLKLKWQQITHPDEVDRDQKIVDSIVSGERDSARWEKRYIHKEGRIIWADVTTVLQRDRAGKPLYLISTVVDITDRKRAEDALRTSERQLSSIYNTVGDVVFHLAVEPDGKYRFISVNHAFRKVTGLSEDMVVGKLVNEVIPEPSLSMVLGKYKQAIEENAVVRWEETSDYPTGRLIGDVSIAPVVDDRGRCTHLVGAVHDITERKRAEEALSIATEQLQALIHSSPVAIIVLDPDGIVKLWNPASELVFGWTETEALGRFLPYVPQDKREEHDALRARVLRGESFTGVEVRRRRKDGMPVDISVSTAPLRDNGGRVTGVMSVNVDITERKRAEEAMAASEMRYRRLFEAARDGILILDAETGMVVDVNPFLIRMLGYSYEQFKGKAIWELGMLKDVIANQEKFLELRQQGYVRHDDLPLETAEGQRMHVEFVSNVYLVDQIKVIQCNIRNITERRVIEEKLRTSEVSYRRLFEAARDGILILDADTGVVTKVNPFLVELLGYSREQFLGKTIWELGLFKDIAANKSHFVQLQQKEFVQYEDVPLETAKGRSISVEFVSHVYQVGSQKVIQCNIRDITDRMQAEKKVLGQLEELRRWQEVTLGREDRIRQLKHEVDELLARLGEPVRYPSVVPSEVKE